MAMTPFGETESQMSLSNNPFESYAEEYDEWFEKNNFVYLSELELLKTLVPKKEIGIEIGIGTGRFAEPLNIKLGLDPSKKMFEISSKKDMMVINASAEDNPFKDKSFDFVLMVTTLCFLDNLDKAFSEIYRTLKPKGKVILGFVDKSSALGKDYEVNSEKSKFYRYAHFFSTEEVISLLKKHHFRNLAIKQTIFKSLDELTEIDDIKIGYGQGSFIGIQAVKF